MDAKKIEVYSINNLKTVLERCDQVSTMLSENDKTPSWDGKLFYTNLAI